MNRTTLKEMNVNTLCFQVPITITIDGHKLEVKMDVKYELDFTKEIGRGGTCLVYHAYKILEFKGKQIRHKVVLKEFFPKLDYENEILRADDGSLIIPESVREQALYKRKLQRFLHSYELYIKLHNEEETNQYIVDADELIEANGTWYLSVDYNEAGSLDTFMGKETNLYDFCQIMRNVSLAVSCFHDLEYLHLDLTPGNIMVFKDLSVKIMDSDSLLKKDELFTDCPALSISDGYGAPELLEKGAAEKLGMLGERSDIFSFGAIIYRYLFGKRLDFLTEYGELDDEKARSLLADFSYEKELEQKIEEKFVISQDEVFHCSQNVIRKIREFLRLLLHENMFCRYGDMKEVTEELETILPLIEPKGIYLQDNFKKNMDVVFGRENKLHELQKSLESQGEQGQHRLTMIFGIGGIGKSTLARAYAEEYLENYEVIIELAAESAKEVINGISIANFESDNFEERLALLKNLLQDQKILLIVHDYNRRSDETFAYFRELPCDVILTGWSSWTDSGVACIELRQDDLSEDAALNIFKNAYLQNAMAEKNHDWKDRLEKMLTEDQEALKELLRRMEYHPLTLKLLGMQMAYAEGAEQTPSEALEDFVQFGIMPDEWTEIQNQKDSGSVALGDAFYHMQNIYGTALKKGSLKEEELEVLRYMTLLSVEPGICVERFIDWTKLGKETGKILTGLRKKGWLEYHSHAVDPLWETDETGGTKGTYYMPMGIAEVLYRQEQLRTTAENIVRVIVRLNQWEGKNDRNYVQTKTLVMLAEILVNRILEEETSVYSDLLHTCGLFVFENADSSRHKRKALQWWEKELLIRVKHYKENGYIASVYVNISNAYREFQEYNNAIKYQKEAIRIYEQMSEKEWLELAISYINLAVCYMDVGNVNEAIRYQEKALEIRKEYAEEPNNHLGDTFCELGMSYYYQGDMKKAIQYIEEGLIHVKKEKGEKDRWVAIRYTNLSAAYRESGNSERALYYAKKAIEILEELMGENHVDTALAYDALAVCSPYASRERIIYAEKAWKILKKILGEDHRWSILACGNLAMFYWEAGRNEEGLQYAEKALKMQESLPEHMYAERAQAYNNLGKMYSENGDWEKGISCVENAREIWEDSGVVGYNLGNIYSTLSFAYWRADKKKKAVQYMRKSWEIFVKCTGNDSKDSKFAEEQLAHMEEQLAIAEMQHKRQKEVILNSLLEQLKKV